MKNPSSWDGVSLLLKRLSLEVACDVFCSPPMQRLLGSGSIGRCSIDKRLRVLRTRAGEPEQVFSKPSGSEDGGGHHQGAGARQQRVIAEVDSELRNNVVDLAQA